MLAYASSLSAFNLHWLFLSSIFLLFSLGNVAVLYPRFFFHLYCTFSLTLSSFFCLLRLLSRLLTNFKPLQPQENSFDQWLNWGIFLCVRPWHFVFWQLVPFLLGTVLGSPESLLVWVSLRQLKEHEGRKFLWSQWVFLLQGWSGTGRVNYRLDDIFSG